MKTQKQKVEEILQRVFLGHPSREDQANIDKLMEIVVHLAEQIDKIELELRNRSQW